jgi:4-hydroxy-tetrahydrodipicolinate synthase
VKIANKVRGVITPIGTPLTDGDRVDEPGLRRLTQYLVNGGVHGILANGTMGGFAFLTDDQQLRAISIVVDEAKKRVPIMGGLGETSTSRAIGMAKEIARLGVDSLSILSPLYYHASQDHLLSYFCDIAAAVDLPVFLYDNPVMTKSYIQPETVVEIRRRAPNVIGIKESNQECVNLQRLLTLNQDDANFSVLTGSEFLIVVGLQMGCSGFVGGLHNLCPHMAVALYEAFLSGNLEEARKLQQDLIETWGIFHYGKIWGAFDEGLRHLGIAERATGAPYITKLTDEEAGKVRAILDRYVKPYLT